MNGSVTLATRTSRRTRGGGALALIAAIFMSLAVVLAPAAPAYAAGLGVSTVSQQSIMSYADAHGIDKDLLGWKSATYAVEPNYTTAPYSLGSLSQQSLNDALEVVNFARYVAGIPSNVTLDAHYNELCQAASLVNCLNGSLSHAPEKPADLSDALYNMGAQGASSSNIAMGYPSPAAAVLGFLSDSDASNIDRVGHRRWVLNPSMDKTGFGMVGRYSAMYAFGRGASSDSYSNVSWPAQNMPVELFDSGDAWSLSTGDTISNDSSVSVVLTRQSDGRTWRMGAGGSDGVLYVDNGNYGSPGCIIFRPNDLSGYNAGDKFSVSVNVGNGQTVEYEVSFFSLFSQPSEPTQPQKQTQTISGQSSYRVTLNEQPGFQLDAQALGGAQLSYASSNQNVATVDARGYVTVRGAGSATITITAAETEEYASATKTVQVTVAEDDAHHQISLSNQTPRYGSARIEGGNTDVPAGERVYIIVELNDGYKLDRIYAVNQKNNTLVYVWTHSDTRYSVIMSAADVVVTVSFAPTGEDPDDQAPSFTDIAPGTWYYDAVMWVAEQGIMNGQGSGESFGPTDTLVRGALAQLLYNMEGRPAGAPDPGYADAHPGDWWYDAVAWCAEAGAMTGYNDAAFGPSDAVTREQLVTVIWRLEGQPASTTSLDVYPDASSVSPYAREAMAWAVGEGIISGSGGHLDPGKAVNRATAATIIARWQGGVD